MLFTVDQTIITVSDDSLQRRTFELENTTKEYAQSKDFRELHKSYSIPESESYQVKNSNKRL